MCEFEWKTKFNLLPFVSNDNYFDKADILMHIKRARYQLNIIYHELLIYKILKILIH